MPRVVISARPFMVRTHNSVYRFGQADKEGFRMVSRDDKPLDFNRCRIAQLVLGERMVLQIPDRSEDRSTWSTSMIVAVEE